jgi:hypothetical protein
MSHKAIIIGSTGLIGLSDGFFTTMHLITQNTIKFIGFQTLKQIIVNF